jgi:hypothetical protein
LPPIGKESKLAGMIVRQIYFRILDEEGQRSRRANQVL